jgi:UDP-2,3-diacylglucosamine pyrophosphatase LpxH
MEEVVIFVSDLHLGRSDELEDFVPENETKFCDFLKKQSGDFPNAKVDLVILGDFLDIWQVATDTEKTASETDRIPIRVDEQLDICRAQATISAHPNTFEALRGFVQVNPDHRSIICITGNHDHSLVKTGVQAVITQAIAKGNGLLQKRIGFQNWYENVQLGIYAEHGNQFDEDNVYDDFTVFGAEAPGYFFVRLFWNRLEAIQPNLDFWMYSFTAIIKNKLWNLLGPARKLFRQYVWDPRPFKRIQAAIILPPILLESRTVETPCRTANLKDFPDLLLTDKVDPNHIFSTDNKVESHLRTLYYEDAGFRKEVDKILKEKFPEEPIIVPKPLEGTRHLEFLGIDMDSNFSAVRGMYGAHNGNQCARALKGEFLKPDIHKFVLLGHTHEHKRKELKDLKVTYFNTGSWSIRRDSKGNNTTDWCYTIFQKSSSGAVTAEQHCRLHEP